MLHLEDYCEDLHAELISVSREIVALCTDDYSEAKLKAWGKIANLTRPEDWGTLVSIYNDEKLNY